MKTTVILIFSFIFITGSLFGQKDKHNYVDSDIRKQFFPVTRQDSPRLKRPYIKSSKKMDNPTFRDLDRFELFKDSTSFKDMNIRLYSDFIGAEEFPGASKYFAKRPNLISSPYAKSFIIKPDTTVKQYLIIIDHILQTTRK
jgi:hypothetical protein